MSVVISNELNDVFKAARAIALTKQKFAISPACFMLAFFENSPLAPAFSVEETIFKILQDQVVAEQSFEPTTDNVPLYASLDNALQHAVYYQKKLKDAKLDTIHVLLSLLSYENHASEILNNFNITFDGIAEQSSSKRKAISAKTTPTEAATKTKKWWQFGK